MNFYWLFFWNKVRKPLQIGVTSVEVKLSSLNLDLYLQENFGCQLIVIFILFTQKSLLETQGQDDNLSDLSCDASTSDSGRGGSDVEMHGAASKESGMKQEEQQTQLAASKVLWRQANQVIRHPSLSSHSMFFYIIIIKCSP